MKWNLKSKKIPVMPNLLLIIVPAVAIAFVLVACSGRKSGKESSESVMQETTVIKFWNGNRSEARKVYERKVLDAIMEATEAEWGPWQIDENQDEYPGDEESKVFTEKGHDLFVTIAGNQKFTKEDKIVIPHLLTKNLLGYRIPIIRQEDAGLFSEIRNAADLQKLKHGIPLTWSDAEIFRRYGYNVVEDGSFDDIFERLQEGLFDYSAYGANEVLGVYENRASKHEGLIIDENILLFYQFPLVFYVKPELPQLADRIEDGFQKIIASGTLDSIFDHHYGNIVEQLNIDKRLMFVLDNPLIPDDFRYIKPDLENL
jgi:ABC-type amino acid transport substrate-binding protein